MSRLDDKWRALSYLEREAAYVAGSVASDIAVIGDNAYRLLEDLRRLYHPEYIFWVNAANYAYARFFSLGEDTSRHFPMNAPVERIFARNVATAVNNQEDAGIRKFLGQAHGGLTALVYVDAYGASLLRNSRTVRTITTPGSSVWRSLPRRSLSSACRTAGVTRARGRLLRWLDR